MRDRLRRSAISEVLDRHAQLRALFDNGWLHLIRMIDAGQLAQRYSGAGSHALGACQAYPARAIAELPSMRATAGMQHWDCSEDWLSHGAPSGRDALRATVPALARVRVLGLAIRL